jgi:putative transposase
MTTVIQAYRFALDPTPQQRRTLASHSGAARFAYNWGLELVKARLQQRRVGEDVEVPWTLPALRREWNRASTRMLPGGPRTARKPTPPAWTGWLER